jgi:5-methylcytosine-specific restriction protein A
MPLMKPCIDCGVEYTYRSRCDSCQSVYESRRGKTTERGYGSLWQRMARAHLRRHRSCVQCGRTDDLTVDHIVPIAKGGKSDSHNLQTLCRSCNSAKRDR